MAAIEARGLRKTYGATKALDGFDLTVEPGRILGLVGPNGAGKTTALNAILGLTPCEGSLRVLGRDPWAERDALVHEASFIADVAVLPRWLKVAQALDYAAGVHPRFDRAKAEAFLARTDVPLRRARGQAVQGHGRAAPPVAGDGDRREAAGARRADARPRPSLPQALLRHPAQRLLRRPADDRGQHAPGRGGAARAHRPRVRPPRPRGARDEHGGLRVSLRGSAGQAGVGRAARALAPIAERAVFGRSLFLFDGADRASLAALGEVRTPGIADVFLAVMEAPVQGTEGGER